MSAPWAGILAPVCQLVALGKLVSSCLNRGDSQPQPGAHRTYSMREGRKVLLGRGPQTHMSEPHPSLPLDHSPPPKLPGLSIHG